RQDQRQPAHRVSRSHTAGQPASDRHAASGNPGAVGWRQQRRDLGGLIMRGWIATTVAAMLWLSPAPDTSLVKAVQSGDRATAIKLLSQGVDVNASEPDGTTALQWAVHRDDADLVDRLVRAGARVNVKNDYGSSPMSEAAIAGNLVVIDRLLKAGADV